MHQIICRSVALAAWLAYATVSLASTYQIDDGTTELAFGPFQGGAMAWLNSFQVTPGAESLTSIDIMLKPFGPDSVVHPLTVYLWTDPTNDGNPADAIVARSVASFTTPVGSFVNIPIAPLALPAGSWFFAGALYARPADAFDAAPIAVDTSNPDFPNRSFFAIWDNSALANPNDLTAGTSNFGLQKDLQNQDANYLVRVNAVPEPSSFVLAALGLIGLVVWRRRKPA
jgi:hypothetical protein